MWLVIDCPFNRDCYPWLIGQVFSDPPSYAVVTRV